MFLKRICSNCLSPFTLQGHLFQYNQWCCFDLGNIKGIHKPIFSCFIFLWWWIRPESLRIQCAILSLSLFLNCKAKYAISQGKQICCNELSLTDARLSQKLFIKSRDQRNCRLSNSMEDRHYKFQIMAPLSRGKGALLIPWIKVAVLFMMWIL